MSATTPRKRHQHAVLTIVLATYLMLLLDVSIVITGLPQIRADLGFTPVGLSWVQTAYTLAFGGFLMLGARAGDLFGRRRMFLLGLALFTFASGLIGFAPSAAVLIGARLMQGIGAAILAPTTLALLTVSFDEGEERTHALAAYAATAGIGSSLGLVLGGVFAHWASWRVGFVINVPVGLALGFATGRLIAETPRHGGGLDLPSALASSLGSAALVWGITAAAGRGWADPAVLTALAGGGAVLAGFVLRQAHVAAPLLPLRLFQSPVRSGAYAARMAFTGAMMAFFFFATHLMQEGLGFDPFQAGLGFLPVTVLTFAAARALPRLTRAHGNAAVLAAAFALAALGMIWLSHAGPGADYLTEVLPPMVLIGLGNGAGLGPLTVAGVAGARHEDAGAAAGLVNTAHQLGGTLGIAALVTLAATFGQQAAFLGAGALLLLGLALTCVFIARG